MAYGQDFSVKFDSIASVHDITGGMVVLFDDTHIVDSYCFGKSDLQRGIEVGMNTKFRVASISKVITAIAVLQLAEKKLLSLDSGMSDILGYKVRNPRHPEVEITPRMLLSHTSSLTDGPSYDDFMHSTVHSNPIPGLDQILTQSGVFYDARQFHGSIPGSYFTYCNLNYILLGTLVERLSKLRFDEYCRKNIFQPLGLDASFNVNDLEDIDSVAVLYRKSDGVWKPQADDYMGIRPVFSNISAYVTGTNAGRFGPQGGLRCSAKDLATLFICLINPGGCSTPVLNPESISSMFEENWRYRGDNGDNYQGLFLSWGLGIHRITSSPGKDVVLAGSTLMLGHSGDAYGLISDAYYDPVRKRGFVFITNGIGKNQKTNGRSAFFPVEQDIFNAVEYHLDSGHFQSGSR